MAALRDVYFSVRNENAAFVATSAARRDLVSHRPNKREIRVLLEIYAARSNSE